MPKRISERISALQHFFLVENNDTYLNKQWACVEDVNSFYISDTEIDGQVTQMSLVN